MITSNRSEFFEQHNAEPCRNCERYDTPGAGVGPIFAGILFESFASAEVERLNRKLANGGVSDDWDKRWIEKNRQIYIRACWLANADPDQSDQIDNPVTEAIAA